MPQTEAITVRQHNVPVRENMSRGSYKKNWPMQQDTTMVTTPGNPSGLYLRGSKVVNQASYPIALTAASASPRHSKPSVAVSPSRDRCQPPPRNWCCGMGVVNLSASVGISTRTSDVC
jgi:hypothetical protein